MDRMIYHGSRQIVRSPKFGAGRQYNDFGLGFYCSEYPQRAAEWATGHGGNGFVSAYELDREGLRIINLCSQQYTPLHWLSLLFNYREFDMSSDSAHRAREYINEYFSVDYQGCDCIIGYRADNSCFMFAQDFLDGRIPYRILRDALTRSDTNRQFVLKSNRAFDRISFAGHEPAFADDIRPAAVARELRAVKAATQADSSRDLFVSQLIREEVRPYDPRLR